MLNAWSLGFFRLEGPQVRVDNGGLADGARPSIGQLAARNGIAAQTARHGVAALGAGMPDHHLRRWFDSLQVQWAACPHFGLDLGQFVRRLGEGEVLGQLARLFLYGHLLEQRINPGCQGRICAFGSYRVLRELLFPNCRNPKCETKVSAQSRPRPQSSAERSRSVPPAA